MNDYLGNCPGGQQVRKRNKEEKKSSSKALIGQSSMEIDLDQGRVCSPQSSGEAGLTSCSDPEGRPQHGICGGLCPVCVLPERALVSALGSLALGCMSGPH